MQVNEAQKTWIHALESGKYKQGHTFLQNKGNFAV